MSDRSFSGAIKTEALVGRRAELARIRTSIPEPDDRSFRCVIIRAEGGKGKTHLLHAVAGEVAQLGRPKDSIFSLSLIDVADPVLHSITAFLDRVYVQLKAALSETQAQLFTLFAEHLEAYRRARDGGAPYHLVVQRRAEVVSTFEQAYRSLTERARVVWVLDTMEQLFSLSPEIEALLSDELGITATEIGPTTYDWLYNFILRRQQNTTVLLAGRPDPGRWAAQIMEALTKLDAIASAGAETLPIEVIELENFSYPESQDYIRQLAAQFRARGETSSVAEYLDEVLDDQAQLEVLHRLTEGNPIRLALYIDLLVNDSSYPEALRTSPRRLAEMTDEQRAGLRADVDRALLTYIARGLGQASHEVLEYLAVMRRGLDHQRLVDLRGGSPEEATAVLDRLAELSFVKVRSDGSGAGRRYYLHDELYTIFQREFMGEDVAEVQRRRSYQQAIFTRLIDSCKRQLDHVVDTLFAQLRPGLADQREEQGQVAVRLHQLRQQRRELQVEILHYNLYLEPREAFNTIYLELVEQAFTASDPELNDQLQSELELFFFGSEERVLLNGLQAGLPPALWARLRFAVLHERISNATRRLISANRNAAADCFVADALDRHRGLVTEYHVELASLYGQGAGQWLEAYFKREWRVYRQVALIYAGGRDTRPAITALEDLARGLEQLLRGDRIEGASLRDLQAADPAFHPTYVDRMQNLVAQAYNGIAYGYATLSAFVEARSAYHRADFILLVTPPPEQVLHATLKNNLARVMAELGATNVALSLCEDGIANNERLGLDYRVAMGYNTKALIYSLGHRDEQAYQLASQALAVFRQLGEPRGIGLALIQLGEACRGRFRQLREQRKGGGQPLADGDFALLREAEKALAETELIFTSSFQEAIRQIETKLAQGCLYADWADALGQGQGADYFDRAAAAYDLAIELARKDQYVRHLVSALLDKAELYARRGLFEQAEQWAAEALQLTPADHRLTPERPLDLAREYDDVVMFRELAKLEALHADIAARQADAATREDEWRPQFERSLRHRILAMTYLQLFSASEAWHLGINADKLYALVDQARRRFWPIQNEIDRLVDAVIRAYHLEALAGRIGLLRSRQIVLESFVLPEGLEYLRGPAPNGAV